MEVGITWDITMEMGVIWNITTELGLNWDITTELGVNWDITRELGVIWDITTELGVNCDITTELGVIWDITMELRVIWDTTTFVRVCIDLTIGASLEEGMVSFSFNFILLFLTLFLLLFGILERDCGRVPRVWEKEKHSLPPLDHNLSSTDSPSFTNSWYRAGPAVLNPCVFVKLKQVAQVEWSFPKFQLIWGPAHLLYFHLLYGHFL